MTTITSTRAARGSGRKQAMLDLRYGEQYAREVLATYRTAPIPGDAFAAFIDGYVAVVDAGTSA